MNKLIVSYQGEPGAFSEQACLAYFGTKATPVARESFRNIFSDVDRKKSAYAVVPIENSLFGSVHQNFDLLQEFSLSIVGEIKLRISMNLMALPGVPLKNIRHVYSHPQGLGQSDVYLQKLKNISLHPFYDTAGAAKMIAEEQRKDAAAIASTQAAKFYQLTILKAGIETDHRNFTRFLIIAKKPVQQKQQAKTSLIFAVKNQPGSLFNALAVFALRNINLLKIESRPFVGKPWEYLFFVDIEGSAHEKKCAYALQHLQELTSYYKNLGSYKIGKVVH